IYYNDNKGPFTDINFRKAMALGTDRDEFLKSFTGGKGMWAPTGADTRVFTQDEVKKLLPFDPEHAKKLLAQSSYKGEGLEMMYGPEYGAQLLLDDQLWQAQMKKIGINFHITTLDRNTLSDRRRKGDYQLSSTSTGGAIEPDVDVLVFSYFHPASGTNY